MSKITENKITGLIEGTLTSAGYSLVRVHISGGGKYASLQVMAERLDDKGMTVEDCATISKLICTKVEAEKELADKYDLEVSSPGIDRPLVKKSDYVRFKGHVAKVDLDVSLKGQKRFQGRIADVSDEEVIFDTEKGFLHVALSSIEKAKLVLTDELLNAAKAKG